MHRLAGAIAAGRFPQATLFVGAPGVGKQRLALWTAQGLLCPRGPGRPCGECPTCAKVVSLSHPDLHWFVPIPRPKAGDVDKQVELAREALGEVLTERRENPLYQRTEGMASHSLASIRLLQRVVGLTPFEARHKVVILGDAERLIVQDSSQEAANALLKVLEEPPDDTFLVLTASEPQALLPTIRSRLVPIRIPRVSDDAVLEFLAKELDPAPAASKRNRLAALAEGAIGRTLWTEAGGGNADAAADAVLTAVAAGPERWAHVALGQAAWGARGDFTATLDAIGVRLRDGLAQRLQSGEGAEPWLRALDRLAETRVEAQRNVNPQLTLAVLASDLQGLL